MTNVSNEAKRRIIEQHIQTPQGRQKLASSIK